MCKSFYKSNLINFIIRSTIVILLFVIALIHQTGRAEGLGWKETDQYLSFISSTITVSTFDDELNDDGDCSLREAVQAANTDSSIDACSPGTGDDTISLPSGIYTLSIGGNSEDSNLEGDLDITGTLTIEGFSADVAIIQAGTDASNGIDRVLHALENAHLGIHNLTIRYGLSVYGSSPHINGGGIYGGRDSVIEVIHSVITDNKGSNGGGITSEFGTILIEDSVISNNHGGTGGGGLSLFGSAKVRNTSFPGNTGTFGGAILLASGEMDIAGCTFSGNTASGMGEGYGGAIQNTDVMTITNTTISGNTAINEGGGIRNLGSLFIRNSTIIENNAPTGGGVLNYGTILTITNSIIVNNSIDDCTGSISSDDYNIDSDGTCSLIQANDLPNTNPLLGLLADNGGPTFTHAITPSSPAFDVGNCSGATVTVDQRGVPRPQVKSCDIGAYEYRPEMVFLPFAVWVGE